MAAQLTFLNRLPALVKLVLPVETSSAVVQASGTWVALGPAPAELPAFHRCQGLWTPAGPRAAGASRTSGKWPLPPSPQYGVFPIRSWNLWHRSSRRDPCPRWLVDLRWALTGGPHSDSGTLGTLLFCLWALRTAFPSQLLPVAVRARRDHPGPSHLLRPPCPLPPALSLFQALRQAWRMLGAWAPAPRPQSLHVGIVHFPVTFSLWGRELHVERELAWCTGTMTGLLE